MPCSKTTSAARADISDACSSSTLHPTRHFLWLLQLVTSWSSKPVPTATLPSNRDCACLRSSRVSRWDLTRRWLTSLPYWLAAGCHTWDTINPHPYGGIDRKVEGWRQGRTGTKNRPGHFEPDRPTKFDNTPFQSFWSLECLHQPGF